MTPISLPHTFLYSKHLAWIVNPGKLTLYRFSTAGWVLGILRRGYQTSCNTKIFIAHICLWPFQTKLGTQSDHLSSEAFGMLAGGFTCAACMDFSGEEGLVLSKGMQETSGDFLVFAENRRPHLGYCSSKPHFRHAMHSTSLGTRSLVLPEFSGLARKTNTPLLKVKSLSNSFF